MLVINKKLIDEIFTEAELSPKNEICGIFSGGEGKVRKHFALKNISATPDHCYLMDPREQLSVFKEIRERGEEMVGIYHSHPASVAYPSAKDVELAFYPEAAYIIFSLSDRQVRGFRIIDGRITAEELIYAET